MAHSSYNNIKKYAAFLFMVFTVLSGSSDRIDSDSLARVGRKAFIDILATNKLFIQDMKASEGKMDQGVLLHKNEGFRDLFAIASAAAEQKRVHYYILLIATACIYTNNLIVKNNIWKNTVF